MKNRLRIILYLLTFAFLLQSFSPVFMLDGDCIEIVENTEEEFNEINNPLISNIIIQNIRLNLMEYPFINKFTLWDDFTITSPYNEISVPPPRA